MYKIYLHVTHVNKFCMFNNSSFPYLIHVHEKSDLKKEAEGTDISGRVPC